MDVVHGRQGDNRVEKRVGPFTGDVWSDSLLNSGDGVAMAANYFAPGARSHWHRHEGGQILTISSGEGLVATQTGEAERLREGDIVWTPPGEEHWHGASETTFLAHFSVGIGETTWLEAVSDGDYAAAHGSSDRENQ